MRRKDRPLERSALEKSISERLTEIVAAAEQAASRVIDAAESEARRHLSEAEAEAERIVAERLGSLSALADSLIAQGEAIRRQSEQLLESLAAAKARLDGDGSAVPGAAPDLTEGLDEERPSPGTHLSAVASVEEPEDGDSSSGRHDEQSGSPAGARLLATQMAVSGDSREEIASRLRIGFEIEDTDAILDAILGPEEQT
jgi:vacuolar-type H+-ATPase subunit H